MYVIPITLFFLSLIALFSVLWYRVVQLRAGTVARHTPHSNRVAHVEQVLFFYAKRYSKVTIIISLRGWILAKTFLYRQLKHLIQLIQRILVRGEQKILGKDLPKLNRIAQYQKKIVQLKDRIKKEEKDFFSE